MVPTPSQAEGPQVRPPPAPNPLGLSALVRVESPFKAPISHYRTCFWSLHGQNGHEQCQAGYHRAPTHNHSPSCPVNTTLRKLWEVENGSSSFNQGHSLKCLSTILFKNGQFYIKERRKSRAGMYSISD